MFSRKNRIPREKLEQIIKQSKSLGCDFFNVKYIENNLDFPRFSIIVSKKVTKSSVGRHLLKRRLCSIVDAEVNYFSGKDCVFFVKKEASKESFKNLKTSFKRFIEKNSL
jgi:ribonuclease P protein component